MKSSPPIADPAGDTKVTRTVTLGFKLSLRRGLDFVVSGERHHDQPVKVGELARLGRRRRHDVRVARPRVRTPVGVNERSVAEA
jgi:hypothetical protein